MHTNILVLLGAHLLPMNGGEYMATGTLPPSANVDHHWDPSNIDLGNINVFTSPVQQLSSYTSLVGAGSPHSHENASVPVNWNLTSMGFESPDILSYPQAAPSSYHHQLFQQGFMNPELGTVSDISGT